MARIKTNIIRRGKYYFVIIRPYASFLGIRLWWKSNWKELPERFLSKTEAAILAANVKPYLKGRYIPESAGYIRN